MSLDFDIVAFWVWYRGADFAGFQQQTGLRTVQDPAWGESNFQSFWVEVGPGYGLDREGLLAHLADADISARRGIMSAHRQPAYAGVTHVPLPVTEHLTDTTLILPVFHQMSESEQSRVVDALANAKA